MANRNLINLFNAYTGYDTGGDEDAGTPILRNDTSLDTIADVRDYVSYLAGGGYTSLSDEESRKIFGTLSNKVGTPIARKLANQVFLYNQRPEAKKYSPEQRISNFYEIGSSDKEVNSYLDKIKSFGTGVVSGFRDSNLLNNMVLSGKENLASISGDSEKAERIKNIASKITKIK